MLRDQSRRMLVCCSRQAGKSTTAAVLVTHRAVAHTGHLALLISPSLRQSGELFRKVRHYLSRVPGAPKLIEDNALSLSLDNGSRIVSLPSSEGTIRGYSAVDTLVEDEAAFVDDSINAAVRPMLAVSGGQLILMSSPNGRTGHFYEAWERGGDAWARYEVKAADVPRIPREFLDAERAAMGLLLYQQEYECAFIAAATGAVYVFDVDRHVIDSPPPLEHYLLGLDFGIVDENGIVVLGWRENDPCIYVVEAYRLKGDVMVVADEAERLERKYRFERIVGDEGGMGKAFAAEMLRRRTVPIEPADKNNKRGYIALLNADMARGRIKVVGRGCADLLGEWRELAWDEKRAKELEGMKNHAADACLYAWRAAVAYYEVPPPPPPTKAEVIAETEARLWEQRTEEVEREAQGNWWEG